MLTHHYDIYTAFIIGVLEEEVYVYPPLRVQVARGQVLKMNRTFWIKAGGNDMTPFQGFSRIWNLSHLCQTREFFEMKNHGFTLHFTWTTF